MGQAEPVVIEDAIAALTFTSLAGIFLAALAAANVWAGAAAITVALTAAVLIRAR